jgi:predicted nucleic acid-binding protein
MRAFVDTNVLLDVLANRRPFYENAARIWTLAESGKIEALISVISFNNVYYVVRRVSDRKTAEQALQLMRNVFVAVPLTVQILSQAIDAGFSDFEDAIQFHSAVHSGAERIITRDVDHFPVADIPVISPAAFLASWEPD